MPRLELNAALIGARLGDFIQQQMKQKFSKTIYIVDSEIARAQIQKESYGFKTFVGVRVGEIQNLTCKEDWFWIEGSLNISDIISRGCKSITELAENSRWQCGPLFLQEHEDQWY